MKHIIAALLIMVAAGCGDVEEDPVEHQQRLTRELCDHQLRCRFLDPGEWECPENMFEDDPCIDTYVDAMQCLSDHGTCEEGDPLRDNNKQCEWLFAIDNLCQAREKHL